MGRFRTGSQYVEGADGLFQYGLHKSLISDESDDRSNVFYCKQLLVDVDEDHDISSAYQMDNEEFCVRL